ncbi:MAG: Maf family protein [Acidobacteriota bacterium]
MSDSSSLELILASGSPRRREMLERLGVTFTVRSVDIDETPHAGEPPEPYVRRLAESKARAARSDEHELVLAADTIVALEDQLLGKPRDEADARRMLRQLSGRSHRVLTGVAVWDTATADPQVAVEHTRVVFAPLSEDEIAWYAASGEPLDKAGAYAVQGLGALFVERLEGNYSNVVGLPLPLTYRLLREAGCSLLTPQT